MSVELVWYPNSWFVIKNERTIIDIDPSKVSARHQQKEKPSNGSVGEKDVTDPFTPADLILVTHGHSDHLNTTTIERLKKEGTIIVAPGSCKKKLGENIKQIAPGESITLNDITISAVHAYNKPKFLRPTMHKKGKGVGYVIAIDGKRIYHAGDTSLIPEMSDLGNIDIALLPIGGMVTMDLKDAAEAIRTIRPKIAVPMHMLNKDPNELRKLIDDPKIDIQVLSPGGKLVL